MARAITPHLSADQLTLEMRILTVADIFDALAAKRPYRDALPLEKVFEIMQKDAPRAIDAQCLDALKMHHAGSRTSGQDLLELSGSHRYKQCWDNQRAYQIGGKKCNVCRSLSLLWYSVSPRPQFMLRGSIGTPRAPVPCLWEESTFRLMGAPSTRSHPIRLD